MALVPCLGALFTNKKLHPQTVAPIVMEPLTGQSSSHGHCSHMVRKSLGNSHRSGFGLPQIVHEHVAQSVQSWSPFRFSSVNGLDVVWEAWFKPTEERGASWPELGGGFAITWVFHLSLLCILMVVCIHTCNLVGCRCSRGLLPTLRPLRSCVGLY